MDSARTALRLGADEVHIVYRRSRDELPARLEEVENAEEEGVIFDYLTLPVQLIGDSRGWLTEIECRRMELGEPDESGRRRPVEVPGSEFTMRMDGSVCAIGNSPNPLIPMSTPGLEVGRKGNIVADEETGQTSRARVWAGGDVVTGAATVISAMGAGRKAARSIHETLVRPAKEGATMNLEEIAAHLRCETLAPVDHAIDIAIVVASDGMSEILAFHRPHALMLTGLTNIQSVRTAMVADVAAIIYVRGKRPPRRSSISPTPTASPSWSRSWACSTAAASSTRRASRE